MPRSITTIHAAIPLPGESRGLSKSPQGHSKWLSKKLDLAFILPPSLLRRRRAFLVSARELSWCKFKLYRSAFTTFTAAGGPRGRVSLRPRGALEGLRLRLD